MPLGVTMTYGVSTPSESKSQYNRNMYLLLSTTLDSS